MAALHALTVWQPWASLIAEGAKPYEFRRWNYLDRYPHLCGQRIAIHAGARPVRAGEVLDLLRRIAAGETSLNGDLAKRLLLDVHMRSWPLSAVLGTAILGEPVSCLDWVRAHAPAYADSDRLDHGKFAWPLSGIDRFEPPVPARGAQGFWNWIGPAGRA